MSNYLQRRLGFIALLLAFLMGCSEKPITALKIGTNLWVGYEPLYLAREKQFINNDQIKLVELSSATQVMQAYRNEVINAAAITLDEALLLLASGEQFSIVLILDVSNGADALIAQPSINSFGDLKGKRVGLESTALGSYMLTRALEVNQMSLNDITIKHLGIEQHEKAFVNKEVDAVITFEPIKSKLLGLGGQTLFDSKQISNEIIDVLIVRESYLENHTNNVQQLINAWFKTLAFIETSPHQAMTLLNLRMKLPEAFLLKSYQGLVLGDAVTNEKFLLKSNEISTVAKQLMAVMLREKLLKKSVNVNSLLPKKNFNYKLINSQ